MSGMVQTLGSHGMELNGPLRLDSADSHVLTWLAKAGSYVLGSVKLVLEHDQVATIRDLQVVEQSQCKQLICVSLIEGVAEFARERGVLKVKVHHNSSHEWIARLFSKLGFKDAELRSSSRTPQQFYLDLYHSTRKRETRPEAPEARTGSAFRLVC